tara:strand:+ start:100 stop:279 length:180 start_codon:yes stop_codon:yes gene_type:complete
MKYTLTAAALVIVGLLFMDDEASKNNRLHPRYNGAQVQDMIIAINHLNSPLPWESQSNK